jgi:class 3 adenylate cyclase
MNTAARIRTQSGELNQKIVGSEDFVKSIGLKDFQMESLGFIDLKGKKEALELFALKI